MRLGSRGKLLLLGSLFALPIFASLVTYRYMKPSPSANYGELLLPPPPVHSRGMERPGGGRFTLADLEGHWAIIVSDSGDCARPCMDKLAIVRQVRLALGRNAERVERVMVIDDGRMPSAQVMAPFEGMRFALPSSDAPLPVGAGNDRAHIYLADPHGNVMLRWPAAPDPRRMLKDLERLLKASQIG
jgi:hypothetical protein